MDTPRTRRGRQRSRHARRRDQQGIAEAGAPADATRGAGAPSETTPRPTPRDHDHRHPGIARKAGTVARESVIGPTRGTLSIAIETGTGIGPTKGTGIGPKKGHPVRNPTTDPNNPTNCPHCKKYGRNGGAHTEGYGKKSHDECFYNPNNKGWIPSSVKDWIKKKDDAAK